MKEYRLLAEGYDKRQRVFWEVARWEQFKQMEGNPYIKPYNKPQTLHSFHPFPWDEAIEIKPEQAHTTEDERAAFEAVIADMLQRRNQAS